MLIVLIKGPHPAGGIGADGGIGAEPPAAPPGKHKNRRLAWEGSAKWSPGRGELNQYWGSRRGAVRVFMFAVCFCFLSSLVFLFSSFLFRAFRLNETDYLESSRRLASTKHTFFQNRLKDDNPLAFYAETGFHRKNMISSNPSAFYVDLDAAASTKHTILTNPGGASKGAPRDTQGAQGTQGITKGPPRDPKDYQGTAKGLPEGLSRDLHGTPGDPAKFPSIHLHLQPHLHPHFHLHPYLHLHLHLHPHLHRGSTRIGGTGRKASTIYMYVCLYIHMYLRIFMYMHKHV